MDFKILILFLDSIQFTRAVKFQISPRDFNYQFLWKKDCEEVAFHISIEIYILQIAN